MKTIQEELKELSAIMDTTTNESDTRYQDKFLYIRGHYPTDEDAAIIVDFIRSCYETLGKKVEKFEKQLNMLDQ